MTHFRAIKRAKLRTSLDRLTWADITEVAQQITLYGQGMYLMEEPVYFGSVFEEAPFMTYSVVRRGGVQSYPEVRTVARPAEELLRKGNHRGNTSNFIVDGSFEMFGQNGGDGYDLMTVNDQASVDDFDWLPGENYWHMWTRWLQTNDVGGAKWKCASDRAHHGRYSAKVTLSGTDSRKLLPFDRESLVNNGREFTDYPYPEKAIYSQWMYSYLDELASNPPGWHQQYVMHVYSEAPCRFWMWGEIGEEIQYGIDQGFYTGTGSGLEAVEFEVVHDINPGGWQRVVLDLPIPYRDSIQFGSASYLISRLYCQVQDGTSGTSVWVDDAYLTSSVKTIDATPITIGVAEWVQDDQKAFIGAKLWFAVGEPSLESPAGCL